jgi:hypothetical protein
MTHTSKTSAFQMTADVSRIVTPEFLAGNALGDAADFITPLDEVKIDEAGLVALQDEALTRFGPNEKECDAWLAPRLHCILRISRRQARNQGFWRWCALVPFGRYVRHRWAVNEEVAAYRYLGGSNFLRRNGVSRLWWGAEAMRNGPDYTAVESIFLNSGLEQYILDLRFGHLRASALALARVGAGLGGSAPLTFDQLKELSKRANLLLSGTALESLAPASHEELGDVDRAWLTDEPNTEVIIKQKVGDLRGPTDGRATDEEITAYCRWYSDIARRIAAEETTGAVS